MNEHTGKTMVIGRFNSITRAFAPFVAGIGRMNYLYFITYNIIGGFLWVSIFVLGGYFFGNIPLIKKNFAIVIFIIIFVSILPAIVEVWKHLRQSNHKTPFERTWLSNGVNYL